MQLSERAVARWRTVGRWVGPTLLAVAVSLGVLYMVVRQLHAAQDEANLHQIVQWILSGQIAVQAPPAKPTPSPSMPSP